MDTLFLSPPGNMYDEFGKAEGGGSRAYLGGLEGVVWCEGDVQEEDPSLVD